MNVEELRNYCLSLGTDVEEKMPFQAFKAANGVLAFYVCGHMFCYFDIDRFEVVSVKCQPERIIDLKERFNAVTAPYNMNATHWIGVLPGLADDNLMQRLVRNSYEIVKQKYSHKQTRKKSS